MSTAITTFNDNSLIGSIVDGGWVHWRGNWSSIQYPYGAVIGTLSIALKPYDEMVGGLSKFQTNAIVVYNGSYRNGASVQLPIEVELKTVDGNVGTTGNTSQSIVMTFKVANRPGVVGQTQQILYQTTTITRDLIQGTYQTRGPDDKGTFIIMPTDGPMPSTTDPCVII